MISSSAAIITSHQQVDLERFTEFFPQSLYNCLRNRELFQ
ncbi:hypothetical protein VCHA41O249_140156 [Vibrio chagasii]|nr:hypothetical protein VCHA41O249_140156 [Vibrio chagasii]